MDRNLFGEREKIVLVTMLSSTAHKCTLNIGLSSDFPREINKMADILKLCTFMAFDSVVYVKCFSVADASLSSSTLMLPDLSIEREEVGWKAMMVYSC